MSIGRTGIFALLFSANILVSCGGSPAVPVAPKAAQQTATKPASSAVHTAASAPPATPTVGAHDPAPPLSSDEGMWLLNDFPSARVGERHGFAPSQAWLDQVRLSAVRVGGCSGSFVSPQGLVMTNHHCALRCLGQLSTARSDYTARGFYAKTANAELKCPDLEVNQLIEITDVTDRVTGATKGLEGTRYNERQKEELSKIEKECATAQELRCDVVTLYRGGRHHLYKYRRYQDARLVFAPEFAIAFFGGDPDNFMFPRYDLDVSFLRVYQNDKPLETTSYFRWSPSGAKDGDLTFVAGHPVRTSRELTIAELEYLRDVALPAWTLRLSESRGLLTEFQTRGAEPKRISGNELWGVENDLKRLKGELAALHAREVWDVKVAGEQALRARVKSDSALESLTSSAWNAIARAQEEMRAIRVSYEMLEQRRAFWSKSLFHALLLVRAADELSKPNEQRLREYVDSQLPALRQRLFARAPIYDELEIETLTHSLTKLREELGPDNVVVKTVLGKSSPREVAVRVVEGTQIKNPDARKLLFDGGKSAILSSKDPMIELARLVEPAARAIRKTYEEEVEAVVKKNAELIARARFQVYGTSVYPDATATLRLSFGTVRGWEEDGKPVLWKTDFAGAFERATGSHPFALPETWVKAKSKLDLTTPLNFSTTNDIIGGNSGSPVLDREARIVGLIFDGNIHSLGGEYMYEPQKNRAVAVHSAALVHALDKIYGADRVLDELSLRRSSP